MISTHCLIIIIKPLQNSEVVGVHFFTLITRRTEYHQLFFKNFRNIDSTSCLVKKVLMMNLLVAGVCTYCTIQNTITFYSSSVREEKNFKIKFRLTQESTGHNTPSQLAVF